MAEWIFQNVCSPSIPLDQCSPEGQNRINLKEGPSPRRARRKTGMINRKLTNQLSFHYFNLLYLEFTLLKKNFYPLPLFPEPLSKLLKNKHASK